jgi:hypothetical protein
MAIWSMSAAPMLMSTDVAAISASSKTILLNERVNRFFFGFLVFWFFLLSLLDAFGKGNYPIRHTRTVHADCLWPRVPARARSLSRATTVANPNHTPGIPFTQLLRYTQHIRRTRDNSTVHSTGGQNQLATKIC